MRATDPASLLRQYEEGRITNGELLSRLVRAAADRPPSGDREPRAGPGPGPGPSGRCGSSRLAGGHASVVLHGVRGGAARL